MTAASATSSAALQFGLRRSLSRRGAGGPGTPAAVLAWGVPWLESYSRISGSGSAPAVRAMARMCPRA